VEALAEAAQRLCKSTPAQADTLDALLQYLKLMDYLDQRAGPLYVKGGTQWMLKEEASQVLQVEMQTSQNTVRVRCDRVLPELYRIAQGLGNDVFHIREVALEKYPGLGQIEGEEKSP
jgi:anion-transporting  ArsA/GET3 family ATPase